MEIVDYTCNVCGAANAAELEALDRETGRCVGCGSWVRTRATTHLLALGLFGDSRPVPQWPDAPHLAGLGVSDWKGFAEHYPAKVGYRNTWLHRRPVLDVRRPDAEYQSTADFVSCSDVLEHVEGDVDVAFAGLHALLKPGGIVVLTVPYGFGETVEHFPNLHDWRIEEAAGGRMLVNRRADGVEERFTDLCFHGGPGQVLEMRRFGLPDILARLDRAGFADVEVMDEDVLVFGIRHRRPFSRPILARKAG
jgi:SAM-dependent methyltransferase